MNKPIAKIDFRPLSGPVITWHLPPKKIGTYEVYAIDPGGQPHGQTMTPKQQDERSLDAVTRKVANDYFRFCDEAGDKPISVGLWKAHLQSALLNNLKALSAHLGAQGDVAKGSETPGTVDAMGMLNVPCKFRDGWLYIPHADGNWVTAAKLVPFSLAILANKFPDAAITTDAEAKP